MATRSRKPPADKFDNPGPSLSDLIADLNAQKAAPHDPGGPILDLTANPSPAGDSEAANSGRGVQHEIVGREAGGELLQRPPEQPADTADAEKTLGEMGIIPDEPFAEIPGHPLIQVSDEPFPPEVGVSDAATSPYQDRGPPSRSPEPQPRKDTPGAFPTAEGPGTYTGFVNELARKSTARPPEIPARPGGAGLDGDVRPPDGSTRYVSRITITDTWAYNPRELTKAPSWIDRNWLGHGDWDPVRRIEPGPCLRVPLATGDIAICRPGDVVVIQSITGNDGQERMTREVWERAQFDKFFMPQRTHEPA